MSELPYSFRLREDRIGPHFAACRKSMPFQIYNKKLRMEFTSKVEWEEDVFGEGMQGTLNISIMFLRLVRVYMDIHFINLHTCFAWYQWFTQNFQNVQFLFQNVYEFINVLCLMLTADENILLFLHVFYLGNHSSMLIGLSFFHNNSTQTWNPASPGFTHTLNPQMQ